MYSNQIGLVGMKPKSLPFHMTGILFYTRRYIVNVLLIYFYIKSKNKNQSLVFICIYVFFAGIASISRSICGILLIPIAAEAIISKKYSRATIIIVYFAVIYEVVSELRNYVYSAAYIKYSYKELVDFALQMLCGIDGDWLVSFVSGICTRLGGWQGEILGSQYHGCTITDLLHYFLGEGQGQVIPNMTENLYGFSMPSDKSFGIGIGFFGVVISASSGNYVFIIISGIVVGMLFFVQEKVIRKEMLANSGYVKVLFMIGMSALSIFSIFVNGSTKMFYISTVVILIVHYLVKIKSK
jgi:hypothetical protein